MFKKLSLLVILLLPAVILLSGCETVKGFAAGVESTARGIGDDIYNAAGFLQSADGWIRKNAW